jgi:hypothetical protein
MRSESPAEVVNNKKKLDIGFRPSQIHQRVPSSLGRERERERRELEHRNNGEIRMEH